MATQSLPSVHGHEIIHLIHDAAEPFTRASLAAEVARRYGGEARFHTCSAQGLTFEQLMVFLFSRGKVVEQGGRLRIDLGEVCGNGDDDHHHHDH